MEEVEVDGVRLSLSKPSDFDLTWIGQKNVQNQLLASWLKLEDSDLPLTPRIIGPPGVGKTTLAYSTARQLGQDCYFFQGTLDTRPEDLIVIPVVAGQQKIRYVASPIVSAMITGSIVILDEGNRMQEKSWASLAPLLDQRRYVESQLAGITIHAHPNFRMAVTMNVDVSTFDLPEYISSRLQPIIELDFPSAEEERQIIKYSVPFATQEIIDLTVAFLQAAHNDAQPFTVRAGIQIVQYTLKLRKMNSSPLHPAFYQSIQQILGDDAVKYV